MSGEAAAAEPPAASAAPEGTTQIFLMDGSRATVDSGKISLHDFNNPTVLSQADLRVIDTLYQRYARQLAARLSAFLRMECSLKVGSLTTLPFSKFCESTAAPACITMFGIEELRGVGILEMSLPLALSMADRLLGGKGRAPTAERPLTEIEMALLADAIHLIITGWAGLWASDDWQPHPLIIGHETSARCLQTAGAADVFVALVIEVSVGEATSQFQVAVPFSMIELSVRKLVQAQLQFAEDKRQKPVHWRKPYAGITVPILAEWKVREMPLADTLRINKGDIIELPGALINKARLRLSELETFVGTVGIQNGHVAVQITGPIGNDSKS